MKHEREKTQRLACEAFEACPQRQVFTFRLLHRELSNRVRRWREMLPIDTCRVRVITGDAKRLSWALSERKGDNTTGPLPVSLEGLSANTLTPWRATCPCLGLSKSNHKRLAQRRTH